MIIGLQGYAGSGKSTVASYLVERYGFARRHI
jgi:dephospho-CoA kinase